MAGDWIKMRGNLWDDPRVAALVDATETSEAAIVGGLYWLWATADQHTEDGFLPGLTLRQIDRKTGITGFGAALVSIGWLTEAMGGVVLENFTEHNGQSAKRRCTDAQRKANSRNLSASEADIEQTEDGQKAPECGAREEKRREEKNIKPKSKAESRATRLPQDWSPTVADIAFCQTTRPDLEVAETASRFKDYWLGVGGSKGCKLDWPATWRNWVRNEKPNARAGPYETAKDRSRREASEQLTGRKNDPTIIDITPNTNLMG
jgi:hypothetical protein